MQEEIIVQENSSNKRLDSFIAEKIENLSRTGIQKLIEDGEGQVNEKEAKASFVEKTGYSEAMRTSSAQDWSEGIQSMCMEYQQACI